MLVVIEGFLTDAEAERYRQQLAGARWQDGVQTAGGRNAQAKHNRQTDPACEQAQAMANDLLRRMGHHPTLVSACLPHRIFPPVFNRYGVGEAYGAHVDAAIMRMPGSADVIRSDVSMTLFLSPVGDYDGGELVIEDRFGVQEVRLDAGGAVVYPSSSLHRVNPVSRGQRLAAVTWMQSMVPEAESRSLLFDLDQSIQALSQADADSDEVLRLTAVYHNLVRKFAEV